MRWLLLVLLLGAAWADNQDDYLAIKQVMRSWKHGAPSNYVEHHSARRIDLEDSTSRSKRAVFEGGARYLAATKSCQTPGYTGEFCETPICAVNNPDVQDFPDTDGMGATFDTANLANCTEQYVILVDETQFNIRVELATDQPTNPIFTLIAQDGSVLMPDITKTDRSELHYNAEWFTLPPGRYVVAPSADLTTSYCYMIARANTALNIDGGFVNMEGSQPERNDFPDTRSAYKDQLAVGVFHANGLRSPASLLTVTFLGQANMAYRSNPLKIRYNCSYEYIYESLLCRQAGNFLYTIEGVTFAGYGFRRVRPFTCIVPPATPSLPPQTTIAPTPLSVCKNNGVLIKDAPDGSSYCYCTGLWSGDDCSQIICMNGASVVNNQCQCNSGFNGDHCQDVLCQNEGQLGFDADHPTLTVVLRIRNQTSDVVQQFANAVQQMFTDLQFDPTYLNNFILVAFNNDQILLSQQYTDFTTFQSGLTTAISMQNTSGKCYDSVFGAVSSALDRYPTNKSPVYVLTDAPPDDVILADSVLQQASYWRAPIHFIFVQPDPTCTLSIEDSAYRAMDSVAKKTGGEVFYVSNRTTVQDLVLNHMSSTIYRTRLMLSNNFGSCNMQNNYQSVSVDATTDMIIVVATGTNLQLIVMMPEGTYYTATQLFAGGNTFIWSVNGAHSGNWFFNVYSPSSGSPCGMKVYQKSYSNLAKSPTQYDLFWAFTTDIDFDAFFTQPFYGFQQAMVAHLTSFPRGPAQYMSAALNVYAIRNGVQTTVYDSNGVYRDGCTFNFYFPGFTCTVPNELLYFNFFTQDTKGIAIQRAGTLYCSQFQPTINPPSGCLNGGVISASNQTCFCPPGYSGSNCQLLNCYNGGTPSGAQCACPLGWTGTFCELAKCLSEGPTPEYAMKFVDMVFAVELTQNGISQVAMLNKYFAEVIRDVQSQDAKWIDRFVLVGFNSTWSDVLNVSPATDPSGIIFTLNDVTTTTFADPNIDKNCGVKVWEALDKAILRRDTRRGSFIEIFLSSTPDNSDRNGWNALYEFSRSMDLRVTAFQGVSPRNPNQFYCNGTQGDFEQLYMLDGSSIGQTYQTQNGNIGDIIRVIPLQYFSGLVYSRYEPDCTYPVQMYFPIDSYAQTIQLDTLGQNLQISLYSADGTHYPSTEIVRDTFTGWMIGEVRKPCDDSWEQFGQSCVKYITDNDVYTAAWAFCQISGGFLADDLTDTKHNSLKQMAGRYSFWMGLSSNGTQWTWDRPNGVKQLPLNQPDVFWAGGVAPDPADPVKRCVYFDGSKQDGNTWVADSCDLNKFYLCQKHGYDQNYAPTKDGNDIPAGKWYVNVTTKANDDNPFRGCYVSIRVQSELQIMTGYSQQMTQDYPNNDPIKDSTSNRLMTYVHSLDNEARFGLLSMAYITNAYADTPEFYSAARYQFRLGCSYPWISQTFACPNPNNDTAEFSVAHTGEDVFGEMFQRITYGHCSKQDLTCGNGGYRWNGTCVCDEYWQGRYCSIPVCVNNGTLNVNENICMCQPGFSGSSCQYESCQPKVPATFTSDSKTLILTVELSQKNMDAVMQLVNNLPTIIDSALANSPNYFINYILVTFNSTGIINSQHFFDVPDVVAALNTSAQSVTDPGSCTMPLYSVVGNFLNSGLIDYVQWPNSDLLVVTSAGASDSSRWHDDFAKLSDWKIILHYLYQSSTACGETPTDGSLANMVRLAYTSNGNVAFMKSSNLAAFLTAYLPTRYAANMLSTPTYQHNLTCSGNDWYVAVDLNTTAVYVTTTADYGSLGVLDPTGQTITPSVLYNADSTKLYLITIRSQPGIYKMSFVSPGACFASIYSYGGAQVYTQFALTTSTNPTGSQQDGTKHSPTAFVSNVATVHLLGQPGHMGRMEYIEIYDVDSQQGILRSELTRRFDCSYEYYSDPFTCSSDLLVMFIYGKDEFNSQFRRQSVAYCLNSNQVQSTTPKRLTTMMPTGPNTPGTTPTTPVPTTSYGNRNLRFDVVFLIDVSKTAQTLYADMAKFIQTLMLSYTISTDNVHVGMIPVFGDSSYGPMAVAQLNTITSQSVLISYLNELKDDYSDFDDQGQYIQQALTTATNPNYITLSNGYRPITNHLIIYVTSTSSFSDTPATAPIFSAGTYGIITVGYGAGAQDGSALQNVAGGANCVFIASDFNALNMQVRPGIQNLIWAADGNGGKYCGN